jgi:hypothetical protein
VINKIDQALKENAVNTPFKGMKSIDEQEMDRNSNGMLKTMNMTGYVMYAGTADPEVVRRRRAKSKTQRASRRINRKKK